MSDSPQLIRESGGYLQAGLAEMMKASSLLTNRKAAILDAMDDLLRATENYKSFAHQVVGKQNVKQRRKSSRRRRTSQ